jgi:Spy/CpxP family protein refolding chaperone
MNGKLKAVLLLGVMYGLGIASGMAWQGYRFHHMSNPHSMFAERRLKKLSSQLKLTPTQEQAIRDIFQKAHERAVQVNEEVSWDLADIHKDSVKAIKEVLTPTQAAEFEKMHQKFHTRHKNLPDDDDEDDNSQAPVHHS